MSHDLSGNDVIVDDLVGEEFADTHPRTFLLTRFKDEIEAPVGEDKDEVMEIVMHYRHLVSQRLKTKANSLPMSHFAGPIGSILFQFYEEFPSIELPLNGGISEFSFQDYDFKFGLYGARAVETINMAEKLHTLGRCIPSYCVYNDCVEYSSALDENLIMSPIGTYFLRSSMNPEFDPDTKFLHSYSPSQDFASIAVRRDPDEKVKLDDYSVLNLCPSEHLLEIQGHEELLSMSKGQLYIDCGKGEESWEVMPAPNDASQLDMHLAKLSSLDTLYVLRFTSEVKHMFHDLWAEGANEQESDEESDKEDSYVESALVPGLQQRDFNRVIDISVALSGLVLDTSSDQRMRELLNGSSS